MMTTLECDAILFDLDGVLVDSTRCIAHHWHLWAIKHGLDPEAVLSYSHGRRTIETIQHWMPHLDADAEALAHEAAEAADPTGLDEMDGAVELLHDLPEGGWAVATSGTRATALSRLEFGRLPIPSVLVTADDVVNGKPHPEPYLKAAQGLGVDPSRCVVIEDAPTGLQAARAAGMQSLGVASTHSPQDLVIASAVVSRLKDIKVLTRNGSSPTRFLIRVERPLA